MATTDDFAGRSCPFCGAVDSLDVDADRGEAACVECAKVVRMGLEESVFTRFNEGATYEDADARGGQFGDSDDARLLAQADGSGGLSRHAAAALAAGLSLKGRGGVAGGGGGAQFDLSTDTGREAKYRKEVVHNRMKNMIDHFTRISRRAAGITDAAGENPIKAKALSIARTYVGYRREHGKRVEHQSEVAAACFQIASEIYDEPVPLAELRVLDPSLKNVEGIRREVIADTKMEETEAQLRRSMAPNLTRFYLRLLQVQMSRFEEPTLVLLSAVESVARKNTELAQLVEAEKVFAAVLLARTEPSLTWEGKPRYIAASEPPLATAYASFAASAHLNASRVEKVMQMMYKALPDIKADFTEKMKAADGKGSEAAMAQGQPVSGVKRERSP